MAKKIFINNLNTFVSKALIDELIKGSQGGEDDEPAEEDMPVIYGTYIDKDSSSRIEGIKIQKMLKVSKVVTIHFNSEVKTTARHEVSGRVRSDCSGSPRRRPDGLQAGPGGSQEAQV